MNKIKQGRILHNIFACTIMAEELITLRRTANGIYTNITRNHEIRNVISVVFRVWRETRDSRAFPEIPALVEIRVNRATQELLDLRVPWDVQDHPDSLDFRAKRETSYVKAANRIKRKDDFRKIIMIWLKYYDTGLAARLTILMVNIVFLFSQDFIWHVVPLRFGFDCFFPFWYFLKFPHFLKF